MILNNARCYLAGPVEFSKVNWRQNLLPKLSHLKLDIYNPIDQPSWFRMDGDTQIRQRHFCNDAYGNNNTAAIAPILEENQKLREICLRLVAASDFIICKIAGITVGTFEEIKCALDQNKPVLFLVNPDQPIDSMWRLAQFVKNPLELQYIYFRSDEDLIGYLDGVNCGLIPDDQKIKWSNLLWKEKLS